MGVQVHWKHEAGDCRGRRRHHACDPRCQDARRGKAEALHLEAEPGLWYRHQHRRYAFRQAQGARLREREADSQVCDLRCDRPGPAGWHCRGWHYHVLLPIQCREDRIRGLVGAAPVQTYLYAGARQRNRRIHSRVQFDARMGSSEG